MECALPGVTLTSQDYTLAAGQTLSVTNDDGFAFAATDPTASLTIAGDLTVAATGPGPYHPATGVYIWDGSFYANSTILITSTGAMHLVGQGGPVGLTGIWGNWTPHIVNNGLIEATSPGSVAGVVSYGVFDDSTPAVTNTGTIHLNSGIRATGVSMPAGDELKNSGLIDVYGASQATGVEFSQWDSTFTNTGTIRAHVGDPSVSSIAVYFNSTVKGGFLNAGVLEGDYALKVASYGIGVDTFQNTGRMVGKVDMGPGGQILVNSGVITGQVTLGDGDDTYDGHLATSAGDIFGGAGNDTLRGGQATETLHGGDGADFLVAGSGAESLEGDAGNDTLIGVHNTVELSGGAGDDLIEVNGLYWTTPLRLSRVDGGDGNDTFQIYAQPGHPLTIDGGAGQNTLELHDMGAASDPLVLRLDGVTSAGAMVATGVQTVSVVGHLATVLGGDANETITAAGSIDGGAGDDVLTGSSAQAGDGGFAQPLTGEDVISGGLGNDTIAGLDGRNSLFGGDGDDRITGGAAFDLINGNKGADTIDGGAGGSDWLCGGQGNDVITAHAGDVIANGNIGDDTVTTNSGADTVRGGQGDDRLDAGAGNDLLFGDRGSDTLTGGAGADVFHIAQGGGADRVTDFNASEGDRVQLDGVTVYTVTQVGSDTVIDLGNGDQLTLVGVDKSSLGPGWLIVI